MVEIIRMPEVLAGAEEAAIQTWLVAPGDEVKVDQPLVEIETDKAVVELTADTDGVIGRLLVPDGNSVAVGDPIFVMLAGGESEDQIHAALAGIVSVESSSSTDQAAPTNASPSPADPGADLDAIVQEDRAATPRSELQEEDGKRLFASPLVRRLAAQHGVSINDVVGTGPNGRIVRRDLERHLASVETGQGDSSPSAADTPVGSVSKEAPLEIRAATDVPGSTGSPYEDVPLDRMRRAIARRLTDSKSSVPHFYLVAHCQVDALLDLRRRVNETASRKVSVNDFILKAVAAALIEVPAANAIWNAESIRQFSSVDLAVAVAIDGGLMTPVLRAVESMSLTQVSITVAELAERARGGRIKQHELEGGSFSVSNLGMYGIAEFSAILNPPQSGILAVGAAHSAPIVDAEGRLAVGQVMTVTLSADHRVIDGAVAAQWLAAFQRRIENPLTIMI